MSGLFEQRERAAETAFVHEEEMRFLARRRAIQMLSAWAAESMGLPSDAAQDYEARVADQFVTRAPDDRLIERIQTDLERAGKPALTTQVGPMLARSLARAQDELRGRVVKDSGAEDPLDSWSRRHAQQTSWGSLRF